jgi:hypothetical protein
VNILFKKIGKKMDVFNCTDTKITFRYRLIIDKKSPDGEHVG